ncbi:MAG: metallophosphoesterase [Akkermansiaceae bacterium]|jgi:hypothetical protein
MKSKPTYLLGDHHSAYDDLITALMRRGLRQCRLIHVGDGEEGYPDHWDSETPERLDNAFASLEIEYLSIRGNHSNPHVFDGSIMLPNFKLLPDYTRLEIEGETWLFVGGAISVNRLDRVPGQTWWAEEEMVLQEDLAKPSDVLVTHTGPTLTTPKWNEFVASYAAAEAAIGTKSLKRELAEEATRHDRLGELVKPKVWYHGHHHHSATHKQKGCTIRQLDFAELVLHTPNKPAYRK